MTEKEQLDGILTGKIRIWRFNDAEQSGSSESADRFLWLCLLRAENELARDDGGGLPSGSRRTAFGAPRPYRFLNGVSTEIPKSFEELGARLGHYEDRGRESIVFG